MRHVAALTGAVSMQCRGARVRMDVLAQWSTAFPGEPNASPETYRGAVAGPDVLHSAGLRDAGDGAGEPGQCPARPVAGAHRPVSGCTAVTGTDGVDVSGRRRGGRAVVQ